MKKKVLWIVSFILLVLVAGGIGFGVWYNKKINSDVAESIVQVSVNPNVQFVLNGANRVIEINYINQDGEIVLLNAKVKGKKINDAVDIFINASIEAGYIDVDTLGTKVEIFVQNKDSENVEKLQTELVQTINNVFDENGIVAGAVAKTKDDLMAKAQEFGVSVEKYSLMLQVSVLDTSLSILELKEKTEQELLEIIKSSISDYKNIAFALKDSFNENIQALKSRFTEMFELDEEIQYLKESINKSNLTEDAKKTINAQIDRNLEQYNALKKQFNEEYENLIEKFEEDSQTYILRSKEKFNELKELNKTKIQQHIQEYKNNRDVVIQNIKDYRDSLKTA